MALQVPRNTFTSFRLVYLDIKEISSTSRCLVLGKYPHIWLEDENKGVFSGSIRQAKSETREALKGSMNLMDRFLAEKWNEEGDDVDLESFDSDEITDDESKNEEMCGDERIVDEGEERSGVECSGINAGKGDEGTSVDEMNESMKSISINGMGSDRAHSVSIGGSGDEQGQGIGNGDDQGQVNGNKKGNRNSINGNSIAHRSRRERLKHKISKGKGFLNGRDSGAAGNAVANESSDRNGSTSENGHRMGYSKPVFQITSDDPMHGDKDVKDDDASDFDAEELAIHKYEEPLIAKIGTNTDTMTSGTRKSRHMSIAMPEPTTEISEELLAAERENHRLRKRLIALARASKGKGNKAVKRTRDLRSKIYRSIIKTLEIGDVILKEKVLMLVKESISVKSFTNFSENEPCDTRVVDRWKEYIMVTRKNTHHSVILQFFKLEGQKKSQVDTEDPIEGETPTFEHVLDSKVQIDLYSTVDKSISVSYPHKDWTTIHIIKFHTQVQSTKWLYFLKQVVRTKEFPDFDVVIPDIGITVTIRPPQSVILRSMKSASSLEVKKLPVGYKMKHTPLIQYMLETVMQHLRERSHEAKIEKWVQNTHRPWFCFRHYDHLEWVQDDSAMFYIQNQVAQKVLILELRDAYSGKKHIHTDSGIIDEPVPIEGFLSRLTTASGSEVYALRPFYKLSYFSTTDNLLFFSKYYRSIPPENVREVCSEVFEHCSYELDEHNHVSWFESPKEEFMKKDRLCREEFQRKGLLVTKSDAVIDLTSVTSIEPVALKDVRLAHKVLLGLLWYGDSSSSEDEFITDSVFEIITANLGRIRLQAPNRAVRDEWVNRLRDLTAYWKQRRKHIIQKAIDTRNTNMSTLRIDEYTDSNISQESSFLEFENSVADPEINSVDSVSMTNHISMTGYLYQKYKKHSNFSQYFAVLSSGSLILYSLYKRSNITGEWKSVPYFSHYLTIPLTECYVYSGHQTSMDLLEWNNDVDKSSPGNRSLPRFYVDGWKSQEEEPMRCFTVWFGRKRDITRKDANEPKNPGLARMVGKLGITGQSIVFMARSRQEREVWVSRIYTEIDRFTRIYNLAE